MQPMQPSQHTYQPTKEPLMRVWVGVGGWGGVLTQTGQTATDRQPLVRAEALDHQPTVDSQLEPARARNTMKMQRCWLAAERSSGHRVHCTHTRQGIVD
mmetsp:Transcript_18288/g.44020  ORF Transcript_18288/g.44020 Transcript_18288/m.44020 type:complete len:99 (-) Transcript_18288:382-678(-)